MGVMKRAYTERQIRKVESRKLSDIFPWLRQETREKRNVTVRPYGDAKKD